MLLWVCGIYALFKVEYKNVCIKIYELFNMKFKSVIVKKLYYTLLFTSNKDGKSRFWQVCSQILMSVLRLLKFRWIWSMSVT